jgi:phosphoribosylformylglycinamidine synthase
MSGLNSRDNNAGAVVTLDHACIAHKMNRPSKINLENQVELRSLLTRHKISEEEFRTILSITKEPPTLAELGVFSAMWSEHCSYKSSRYHLKRFPTKGERVVVGPGENAGVVRLHGKLCLAFKMESHNHPSYIEPYQGAATGVGGILRDVFCMGARPIANLNCLRFGSRKHPRTSYLVPRVVKGIGDYGNCVGIPTVGGSVAYDDSYNGNCLVNAMTVGLIYDDKIFKGFASGVGNLVVYVGSATGRDGIHGATMASDSFATQTVKQETTVQVGDPFAEKLLLEATLEVLEKNLVVGIQDMGAAGLTSSSFEMAGRAGNGVYIDLDRIPVRAANMNAYEILLSESQERMLMVIEPSRWQDLSAVLQKWQLAHAVVGVVTDTGRMQISHKNYLEIDLPVAPLTDEAPVYQRPMADRKRNNEESSELKILEDRLKSDASFALETFLKALHDTGSKETLYGQYDRHIGARSVLGPEHGGAAVMWLRDDAAKDVPFLGAVMTAGCNERRVKNNPLVGSAEAVLKCARQIWAAGGQPLAITDCLNFGSPEIPDVMREFSDSVDGITMACRELDVPVVSGNVSLYNSTGSVSIHPTPMIGMVGRMNDVRLATPAVCNEDQDLNLYVLSAEQDDLSWAASLCAKVHNIAPDLGKINNINWSHEILLSECLNSLRQSGLLVAVREVGEGGLGITAVKMLASIMLKKVSIDFDVKDASELLAEGEPRYLIQLTKDGQELAQKIAREHKLVLRMIAKVKPGDNRIFKTCLGEIDLDRINEALATSQPIGG